VLSARVHDGCELLRSGQLGKGIEYFRSLAEEVPDCEEAHYNLGLAYHRQNRLDRAIAEYKLAIRINPNLMSAYTNLGAKQLKCTKRDSRCNTTM
jgi:tetratricopeptide (TPR) repeat protein